LKRSTAAWSSLLGLAAAGPLACASPQTRGYPLYPQTGPLPDASAVAELSGYVRSVDGQSVSGYGTVFELLPGCHIVRTPQHWGQSNSLANGVSVTTPELVFALPMRAGHSYEIALIVGDMTAPSANVDVKAYERDAQGSTVQTFSIAQSSRDIAECRSAAEASAPAPSAPESPRTQRRSERPGAPEPAPQGEGTVAVAEEEPRWPDVPLRPTSATSLSEAMANPDDLVAHWRRVPPYRSHFVHGAPEIPGEGVVAFSRYEVKLQAKLEAAFADCTAAPWRAAGADQARKLELELVLDERGSLRDAGVVTSSGSDVFDAAVLEAIARAAPFGATPQAMRSTDGSLYLRWSVSSDPTYGCTLGARPHMEQ
jgi:TonB family protein